MPRTIELAPEIAGTVAIQHVEDGATVEKDEAVIEIECMKTMWPVRAPEAGIVRHRVQLGEVVAQGQVVAIIETE